MPELTPGLALCQAFYRECVAQVLARAFPGLAHSAAVMGRGSEVLGFDDELSRDHDWQARVSVFLAADDHGRRSAAVRSALEALVMPWRAAVCE